MKSPRVSIAIAPHKGAGPVAFGMSRDAVVRVMGGLGYRSQLRTPNKYALPADDFERLGVAVMYDEYGQCNAISVGRHDVVDLEYDGYHLFDYSAADVRRWAKAKDPSLDPKDGFTSELLGLGMWADWIDEPDLEPADVAKPAMSFIVFRPGYHQEERARMLAAGLIVG
jgi:hypothetical protein